MASSFELHPETSIDRVLIRERHKKVVKIPKPGNHLVLGENSDITNLKIEILGTGNKLCVGKACRLRGHILIKGNNQTVEVGNHTTFTNAYLLCSDGCDIRIGRHCMLSRGIEVRVTDAHSVIDSKTGERINLPGSIVIGDHVWVGLGVVIGKGVTIGPDNIIGTGSFVNKSFLGSQQFIAGIPARVVKSGVTWNRSQKARFSKDEMEIWKQL
jgi:acetyltransferase-like isoleucine patch superfamily enzyme